MRFLIRAGRSAVSLLDALATLCLCVMLTVYGIAWTVSWPFAATARRSLALSRRITHGAASLPASPTPEGRAP